MTRPLSPLRRTARDAAYAAFVMLVSFTAVSEGQAPASDSTPSRRAFSQLSFRVAGARNVNRERLHDFWAPRDGFEAEISTPLSIGEIGIGVTALSFGGHSAEQPDFDAQLLSLRWGASRRVAGPIALRGAAALGNMFMTFDDGERRVGGLTTESELLIGAIGGVDVHLSPWFALSIETSLQRVLTSTPIDLVVVSAGGRLGMRTPRWLRGVLE